MGYYIAPRILLRCVLLGLWCEAHFNPTVRSRGLLTQDSHSAGFLDEANTAQANCNKVHNLHMYRLVGGGISAGYLLVAWFFLGCAWSAKRKDVGKAIKHDALDM